jgi:hypothetical protein
MTEQQQGQGMTPEEYQAWLDDPERRIAVIPFQSRTVNSNGAR